MSDREHLHELVDSLPEGALESAQTYLKAIQMWPPERLERRPESMRSLTKFAFDVTCACVIAFCVSQVGWANSFAESFKDPPQFRSWYFWDVPFYGEVEVPEWVYQGGRAVSLASLALPPSLWFAVVVGKVRRWPK
jgi:hypothetical protein